MSFLSLGGARGRQAVRVGARLAIVASFSAAILWACGGDTSNADEVTTDGGGIDGNERDGATTDATDAPLSLPFDAAAVNALRYEEGAYMLGTSTYLSFDLAAGTGTYRNVVRSAPPGTDAGSNGADAGAGTFVIDGADGALLRQKLAALPVRELSPACSGNDGPYKWLFVEGPRPSPIVVSNEYICSGGPVVDVIVDGFFDLRTELYRVAGLAPPGP